MNLKVCQKYRCGGKGKLVVVPTFLKVDACHIICDRCGATTIIHTSKNKAVQAWNRHETHLGVFNRGRA